MDLFYSCLAFLRCDGGGIDFASSFKYKIHKDINSSGSALFQKNLINLALNGSKTKSILAEIPLIADDNFNEVNDVNRPDKKMNYCVMDTLF